MKEKPQKAGIENIDKYIQLVSLLTEPYMTVSRRLTLSERYSRSGLWKLALSCYGSDFV